MVRHTAKGKCVSSKFIVFSVDIESAKLIRVDAGFGVTLVR